MIEEKKYELVMGHLVAIVMIGMLVTLGVGFFVGNHVGLTTGLSSAVIEKPDYCNVDKVGTKINIRCNELSDVTLENLCQWASPELKSKVRLVVIA